jgi:hypothetical protein
LTRLYFDHNVARDVDQSLERGGHDVTAARDISYERMPDDAQLLSAVRSSRVLITHNRADFKMLHDAWLTWPAAFGMALPPHPGILILDQAPSTTLTQVLADFLNLTPPEDLANAIFWWRRHHGWRQSTAGSDWRPI